jgi:hypothetical protein
MIKGVYDPSAGHTLFTPKHPEKYKGKYPIIMRSGLERKFVQWCDMNPNVEFWSSESLEIPYPDPFGGRDAKGQIKTRRYYPDFIVKTIKGETFVVEIKPYSETLVPQRTKRKAEKTYLQECYKYKKNLSKWQACNAFCRARNYQFKIITERNLS